LASDAVSLIDRSLFYELAKYYRVVEMYFVPVDGPDPFVDAEIVPYLDQGPSAFYRPGKHELKPKYQAYLDRRRTILAAAKAGFDKGKILLAELRKRTSLSVVTPHR
jgi:hypothetical protein